ncbi:MAG TPA: peptidylprolyl isomerase [Vulgatibacter sp.]
MVLRRGVLLLLLASAACSQKGASQGKVEAVGSIDGEPITAAEVRAALAVELRERPGGSQDPEAAAEYRRHLVDELVTRRLLEQAARQRSIKVEEVEVERALLRLRADYPGDTFDELLESQGLTVAEVSDRLQGQLLVERLFVEEVFARVAITDAEVDAWIEEHPDELSMPERVHALQLVVKTEGEARSLLSELRRGADFGKLAREHSLSPDARLGGDLGWFARGEMPPPFDDVCFSLAPGKLSDVVGSSFGFHVFKVLERRGARKPEPEELRAEAEARLRREKEAAAQEAFVAELHRAARIEIDEAAVARLMGTK